jgi:Protein of unknown function (DUF732)
MSFQPELAEPRWSAVAAPYRKCIVRLQNSCKFSCNGKRSCHYRGWGQMNIRTMLAAGTALLACLAGCGSGTSSSSASAAATSASQAAPSAAPLPSGGQQYVSQMRAAFSFGSAVQDGDIADFGVTICQDLKSGKTFAEEVPTAQRSWTNISRSNAISMITLAAKDMCPSAPAERKAVAAASQAAAAAASKAAAARAAEIRAENTPISAAQWGMVIRNPDAYIGDIYTISGTVAEYNINSNTFATVENAALVAQDANGNYFVVEADSSKLGNVQPGQTFTAKVSVLGVVQVQNTISGGTGEAPDFDASTFTVTG